MQACAPRRVAATTGKEHLSDLKTAHCARGGWSRGAGKPAFHRRRPPARPPAVLLGGLHAHSPFQAMSAHWAWKTVSLAQTTITSGRPAANQACAQVRPRPCPRHGLGAQRWASGGRRSDCSVLEVLLPPAWLGSAPGGRYLGDCVQLLQDGVLILLGEASCQQLVYLLRKEELRWRALLGWAGRGGPEGKEGDTVPWTLGGGWRPPAGWGTVRAPTRWYSTASWVSSSIRSTSSRDIT